MRLVVSDLRISVQMDSMPRYGHRHFSKQGVAVNQAK